MASLYSGKEVLNTPKQGLPNVSQYGWSAVEYEEYRQFIEYINEVKAILAVAISLLEKVEEDISIFTPKYEDFLAKYQEFLKQWERFKLLKAEIDRIYEDIVVRHDDIISRQKQIEGLYTEIVSLTDRAEKAAIASEGSATDSSNSAASSQTSADAAQTSANNAATSEAGALDSYNKSYALYLELQKGMIYRGTWNPHTGAYPDPEGTNSTWDVILNPGDESVAFDGKIWFFGDRLIYILETDTWTQVEAGVVVKSVNGKSGSVVLSAADVGAVSKLGDTMTGILALNSANKQVTFVNSNNYIAVSGNKVYIAANNADGKVVLEGKANPIARINSDSGGQDYTIYHQGFKPTKADVGLSEVNNWTATSDISDASPNKYATAEAVNTVEINRQKTEALAFVYALIL